MPQQWATQYEATKKQKKAAAEQLERLRELERKQEDRKRREVEAKESRRREEEERRRVEDEQRVAAERQQEEEERSAEAVRRAAEEAMARATQKPDFTDLFVFSDDESVDKLGEDNSSNPPEDRLDAQKGEDEDIGSRDGEESGDDKPYVAPVTAPAGLVSR